jgi:DNA processing protein
MIDQPAKQLTPPERRDWLRLSRSDTIGPITFNMLLARYGSVAQVITALPDLACRSGKNHLQLISATQAEDEIAAHDNYGAKLVAHCEPDYPHLLAIVEDAPPLISVFGKADVLNKKCLAIVGARNASLNGKKMAEQLACDFGAVGCITVSGLARGIDTAAHQGSLASGTIAVLAGGIDNIYPQENRNLYEAIAATGCIVAEMPFGSEPRAQHFPRRNRIISGLSLGTVVVEAAHKSGSLITAHRALEQGREVFAVPGSPLDPRCQGTNTLIKQGATLIENAADVLENLPRQIRIAEPIQASLLPPAQPVADTEFTQTYNQIIEKLSPSPVAVDELIRQCHLSPPLVLTVLLEFELAGLVQRQPGNKVILVA